MSSSPPPRGRGRPRKLPADQQRALVVAAARAAFAAHGVQAATIEQIARDAGVTRQAVYEQFGAKEALFAAVVAEVAELALAAIVPADSAAHDLDLRSWVRKNFAAMFAFVAEHPDAWRLLHEAGDEVLTRLRSKVAQAYTEVSGQRWAAHGVEVGRADAALVTMYMSMTEALVSLPWDGTPPNRDAIIDLLTEFTVGGVLRLLEQGREVIARMQ